MRFNVHTNNFAIVQNKLGITLKSFIYIISGNQDLSRDVLHKNITFIFQDGDSKNDNKSSIFQGKNYGTSFIRNIAKRGVHFTKGIKDVETRFMDQEDKDTLRLIIESMIRGQKVSVKKVEAIKRMGGGGSSM